jgi:hypothetical protein
MGSAEDAIRLDRSLAAFDLDESFVRLPEKTLKSIAVPLIYIKVHLAALERQEEEVL